MDESFFDANPQIIYLDGNSLGRLPLATQPAVNRLLEAEWGGELIEAWEHWFDWPTEIGDLLASHLLGASPGTVLVGDSTTVNFYKLCCAALDARSNRNVIITDATNFPTDRYVLEGLAQQRGLHIRWIEVDPVQGPSVSDVDSAVDENTALVTLSHVAYRSAAIADMRAINEVAHRAGALTLWDLSHSVGAMPIHLQECKTDLAVGCTYKYLNGGPGSPAFLYVAPEHVDQLQQPIWGWFGQQDQFAMDNPYKPKQGIGRFAVGTPPVVALAATKAGIESIVRVGIDVLRQRSVELTETLISQCDDLLSPLGFCVASPRESDKRGGHVLVKHTEAKRISVAIRQFAGVIGDFRTPDGIRLAPVAAYVDHDQVVDAVHRICKVVSAGQHEKIDTSTLRVD